MTKQHGIYQKRINAVTEYIDSHLSEKLSIDELAAVAHFSSFHFHRIFQAVMNESFHSYLTRVKLERATRLLSYSTKSKLDIALECGFSSAATFSRAFKKHFSCSPSQYQKTGLPKDSKISKELPDVKEYIRKVSDEFTVELKEFSFNNIAVITVRDSFVEGRVKENLQELIDWAKHMNVYEKGNLLGMSIDDIMVTPKEKYRYLVGITLPSGFKFSHAKIKSMSIEKSKYATISVQGEMQKIIDAMNFLYNKWLINSNFEPAHMHGIEFFQDKEKANDWSSFNLLLALPIKRIINI